MIEKKKWGYKIADFLSDHGNLFIGIAGVTLIGFSSYLLEAANPDETLLQTISKECKSLYDNLNEKQYSNGFWVLIFGLVLQVTNIIISKVQEKSASKVLKAKTEENHKLSLQLSTLESEKRNLEDNISQASKDFYEILNYKLAKLANDKLCLQQTERISVYRHNKDEKHFTMIGRYAKNPYFNQAGRKIYPENMGFIGKAWQNGKFIRKDLPRYGNGNEERYLNTVSREANIEIDDLKKIRMKSSCFYINTIKDRQNLHPVAIVVIESLSPNGLDFNKIDGIFESVGEQLQHDLDALQLIEPKLSIAKNHQL